MERLIKLSSVNKSEEPRLLSKEDKNKRNNKYFQYNIVEGKSKNTVAEKRCNSLYMKAKARNEVNKHLQEKAKEIKLNEELSKCTFQPQINQNPSFRDLDKAFFDKFEMQKKFNKDKIENNNIKVITMYDKYKDKVVNITALKNKEIYVKKKIECDKIIKPNLKRLDINLVLDKNKSVLNDKKIKDYVKRLHHAREFQSDLNAKLPFKEVIFEDKKPTNNLKSASMRCFFNKTKIEGNLNEQISKICKSPSLASLQLNLRSELSKVAL